MSTDITEMLLSLAFGASLPYALVAMGDWVKTRRHAPNGGIDAPEQG